MIFQEPMTALDPSFTIGYQLVETFLAHESVTKAVARKRAAEMLDLVGIADGDRRLDDYPHQFSGGMRQRSMLAMALVMQPKLLIADEPTTALDVTIQAQILDLIAEPRERAGDERAPDHPQSRRGQRDRRPGGGDVRRARSSRVGTVAQIFADPQHPYTQGLLRSMPYLTPAAEPCTSFRAEYPSFGPCRTPAGSLPGAPTASSVVTDQPSEIESHRGRMSSAASIPHPFIAEPLLARTRADEAVSGRHATSSGGPTASWRRSTTSIWTCQPRRDAGAGRGVAAPARAPWPGWCCG